MINLDKKKLAAYIDHTLLSPTATAEQIRTLCEQAVHYGFYSVSVNPRWVSLAAEQLHKGPVKVGGVVSLPLGADTTKIKVAQAKESILAGADEIDMVADLAAIVEGDTKYLEDQFRAVLKVCHSMRPKVLLKVIIESAALDEKAKRFICQVADRCSVDFLKTSTGMHPAGGATLEDIRLIKSLAPHCKVKAAGGIRTATQMIEFIAAGADRIGTSSGISIINEFQTGKTQ